MDNWRITLTEHVDFYQILRAIPLSGFRITSVVMKFLRESFTEHVDLDEYLGLLQNTLMLMEF